MPNDISVKEISNETEQTIARQIRQKVFVEEQGIPFELEEDGLNESAMHLLLFLDGEAIATARMYRTDKNVGEIARVAVLTGYRGKGYGKILVEELEKIAKKMDLKCLRLRPHHYLEKFYADLGFCVVTGLTEQAGEHLLITMEKSLAL